MPFGPILLAVTVLALLVRYRRVLGIWLSSAAGGIAALGILHLTAGATGILLPFNLFSVLICTVLGLPGAVGLLVCNLFWR